jgi:hypothetical protein
MTYQEAIPHVKGILEKYEIPYTMAEKKGVPYFEIDLDPLEEDGINYMKSAMSEIQAFYTENKIITNDQGENA